MSSLNKVYSIAVDIKNVEGKYSSYAKFFDDDRDTSIIKIKLLNNNYPIDLEGCTVEAEFILANNTYHDETCKIINTSEGIVELQLCQECLVAGKNTVRLSILKENEIANTPVITYEVKKGLYSDNPNFNDDPLTPVLSQMLLDVKVTKANQIELQERYEQSFPRIELKIKEVDEKIKEVNLAIASGTQDLEVKEARANKKGIVYAKLGDRLDAVDSQLAHKVNKEELEKQLSAKRDKNIKLNSNDFDISNDNLKIKLVNLSEEVRGAIAGTSTVIGDVANNSITNSKLADGVITSEKLHKDFNYKKDLNSSDDLNSPLDSGVYFMGGNHPANTPEAIKGKSCVLHQMPIMGYYSIQVLYPFNNDNFIYYRTTHYTAPQNNTQWKNLRDINITTNELTREYNYHGILNASNDLNNITNMTTGIYLIQNNSLPLNTPTLNTCILCNYNYLGNYAHQFIIEFENPSIIYNRKVDVNNSSYNSKWINLNSKNLVNKKILTLGDSITYGATSTNNYQDMFEEVLGCEVVNSGYSGSKYALIKNHEPWNTHSFYNKSITLDLTDIDYIWIMYGVNDWNNDVPIGDINSDEYTTCGALYKGLKNLLTRKPTLKIFASTPIFTATEDGATQIDIDKIGNKNGDKLEDYCKSIKEVYKHFRIPIFDGLNECGINLYNHTEYLSDKLHPNNKGNNLIGLRFANFIKQYV